MVRTSIIAEIGINYAYGDDKSKFLDNAKKLIDIAVVAGCDYVKFQKRNPDVCVPEEQKSNPKIVPWSDDLEITYLQYKKDIEFGKDEYDEIDRYCRERGIGWFASVWDIDSVKFMSQYTTQARNVTFDTFIKGFRIMKIPSALITNKELCEYARLKCDYLIISTGMSTEDEINNAIRYADPNLIMHTNSSYPSHVNELRLEYITWLKNNHTIRGYEDPREVGYSGHEFGLVPTFVAVSLGATWIERHITIDRTLWGSDQMSSVEPGGLMKLVKSIRDIELSMGGNEERKVLGSELEKRKSLRGE